MVSETVGQQGEGQWLTFSSGRDRVGSYGPFGCGQFIRAYLAGEGPYGAPAIDPNNGACTEDIRSAYTLHSGTRPKMSLLPCHHQLPVRFFRFWTPYQPTRSSYRPPAIRNTGTWHEQKMSLLPCHHQLHLRFFHFLNTL